METHMIVKPIVHEIRIQNQVIFLDPPIEYARATWIKQLHDWLGKILFIPGMIRISSCVWAGVICRSRRIQSSRYEIGLQMQKASSVEITYVSLVRVLFVFP